MDNEFREPWKFWSKVERVESGCWEWQGGRTSNGYGACFDYSAGRKQGKTTTAHRFSYRLHKGEIPAGLQIDHLCANKLCCNPDHLEAVTQRENLQRAPNTISGRNVRVTHCPQGHEYNAENTYVPPKGGRVCRICNRAAADRFRAIHGNNPYPRKARR